MTQSNQAVCGYMDEPVRSYKRRPRPAICEHWNYHDDKDPDVGYCWMAQGPLPLEWSGVLTGAKQLWGSALREEMLRYNHQIGIKMVGEMLPNLANTVTVVDETDQYGLRILKITYKWFDNDKA